MALFGFVIIYTILRIISPTLAWMFAIGLPALFLYAAYAQWQERRRAIRTQQELQERLKREAEQRAEARKQAAERAEQQAAKEYVAAARREQERIVNEWRRAAEAATAARAAAEAEAAATEARRRRARSQERPRAAGNADARWASADPHVILGVRPGSDSSTIRNAYMELTRQYHPDKVARLAPEFQQLAEERMKTINSAYSRLRERQ